MATKRTLVLQTVDTNNNEYKKSITYANPTASATTLKNFAEANVGLTTHTYVDTILEDSTSLAELVAVEEEGD